jgi:hypothetical protein
MVETRGQLQKRMLKMMKAEDERLFKAPIYEVNIDFDAASLAWRENKRVLENGCFEYVRRYNLRSGR